MARGQARVDLEIAHFELMAFGEWRGARVGFELTDVGLGASLGGDL